MKYILILTILLLSFKLITISPYSKAWKKYCECLNEYPPSHGLTVNNFVKCNNLGTSEEENSTFFYSWSK